MESSFWADGYDTRVSVTIVVLKIIYKEIKPPLFDLCVELIDDVSTLDEWCWLFHFPLTSLTCRPLRACSPDIWDYLAINNQTLCGKHTVECDKTLFRGNLKPWKGVWPHVVWHISLQQLSWTQLRLFHSTVWFPHQSIGIKWCSLSRRVYSAPFSLFSHSYPPFLFGTSF